METSCKSNLVEDLRLILENSKVVVTDVSKEHIDRVHLAFDNVAKMVVALKKVENFTLSVKGVARVLRELRNMIVMGHRVRRVEWAKESRSVKVISADEKDITDLVPLMVSDMVERLNASGLRSFTLQFN